MTGELIVSRYVAESITTDCRTVVDEGLWDQNILQSVVIDSATYLLTISSPIKLLIKLYNDTK